MENVKRTIVRVFTCNKRKRTVTLRPKGMESDYNDYGDVIVDGRTVPGLQMASKVFIIIFGVKLGKPPKLPEYPGRDRVRVNDGLQGIGFGKKRMTSCNEMYGGLKFDLTREGADLPDWCFIVCKEGKPVNVSSSITPLKGERLTDTRSKFQWIDIDWKKVEEYVNTLANLNCKSS